jgi:hypothetical protein
VHSNGLVMDASSLLLSLPYQLQKSFHILFYDFALINHNISTE